VAEVPLAEEALWVEASLVEGRAEEEASLEVDWREPQALKRKPAEIKSVTKKCFFMVNTP